MKKKFFGTDGIRGTVGDFPITPDFVLKLGWATGRVFASNVDSNIVIGKDTRISGYMFESALEAGLSASGANTQLLGPMPTPGIAYLTRTFRARAGIVISASHNPYYDNGIKFFSSAGIKLPDEIELAIEQELEREMTTVSSSEIGKATRLNDAAGRYIEFCKSTIPAAMDFSGMKIVVDCAHGSTYHIAPYVFDEIGADVVRIGCEPNGRNINDKCGATNPSMLQQKVLSESADLGIAFDGDGDRVIMVDHQGDLVEGDELLYIIAKSRLDAGKLKGPVIGTQMTNLGLEQALARLGVEMKRAAVGDRYVMELIEAFDASLGGENSGHIICNDRTTTGDGIVAALQVLAEIWRTRKSLHELKKGMVKFPQSLVNVKIRERADLSKFDCIQKAKIEIERILGADGRVLLRPSGTEPLIRVMVEGKDMEMVDELANQLAEVVSEALPL
ncbi:MAG: phosphoglucosamine mutase [Methylococcaceae bacterium]|nr:phosphoglucosamine mutase [Methylococcaceae bacterium]MCI0733331.1 phosphoglucosamine mutase [Methylococcaceae bacterium]